MKNPVLTVCALALLSGCSGPRPSREAPLDGPEAMARLERLLPDFQAAVRPTLSAAADILKGVDPRFEKVIDYGRRLETHPRGDADSLTVRSDGYWLAFATMAMQDPTVYITRLCLLIGEGRLARAEYVRYFAGLHMDPKNEGNAGLMQDLGKGIAEVRQAGDGMVDEGVKAFDRGEKEKALAFYEAALRIYPKSPRANYEIGLTRMVGNLKEGRIDAPDHAEYFAKTRAYDPFFAFAYQGPKELSEKMLIIMKDIEPALKALGGSRPKAEDFGKFADGCAKLGEWELAAYAYHTRLFMTLDPKTGFEEEAADGFARCLLSLGAAKASRELRDEMRRYDAALAAEKGG